MCVWRALYGTRVVLFLLPSSCHWRCVFFFFLVLKLGSVALRAALLLHACLMAHSLHLVSHLFWISLFNDMSGSVSKETSGTFILLGLLRMFPASSVGCVTEPGDIMFNSGLFFKEHSLIYSWKFFFFLKSIQKICYFFKALLCIYANIVCLFNVFFFLEIFLLIFLSFVFLRQRKQSRDIKRHHRKLKLAERVLAPSKGKLILKKEILLLRRELPSNLLRKKLLPFESLQTLNSKQWRRKKSQNLRGTWSLRLMKTEQRDCCGWINTSPHLSRQSLDSRVSKAVPTNFSDGSETGTRIPQKMDKVTSAVNFSALPCQSHCLVPCTDTGPLREGSNSRNQE